MSLLDKFMRLEPVDLEKVSIIDGWNRENNLLISNEMLKLAKE